MARKRHKNKNEVFYGQEPNYESAHIDSTNYNVELSTGLNYYAVVPLKDRRKYFVDWAKGLSFKPAQLSSIPNDYIGTIASLSRMVSRGFPVNDKHSDWMLNKVNELVEKFAEVKVKVVDAEQKRLEQLHKQADVQNLLGAIHGEFDDVVDQQIKSSKQLSAPNVDVSALNVGQLKSVVEYYTGQLSEFDAVLNKTDAELVEGYSTFTTPQLKKLIKLHTDILGVLTKYQNIRKASKPRKARTPKAKTAEQLVSKVKYLKSHSDYDILSIDPSKLIGSTVAYVFNTKNRKLQYYYSTSGFTVKGTTLQSFDEKVSYQKTIRKPKEFLGKLVGEPRVRSQKMVNQVRAAEGEVTGRINKHCVILKVF